MMDAITLKLCDIQGRLFKLFLDTNYDVESLVKSFMKSEVARHYDLSFSRYHNAWEGYLLDEFLDEYDKKISSKTNNISEDVIFWIGYVYRYWSIFKKESSKKIYKIAPFKTMATNYPMFHTLDVEVAIDNLIEIYNQKKKKHNLHLYS